MSEMYWGEVDLGEEWRAGRDALWGEARAAMRGRGPERMVAREWIRTRSDVQALKEGCWFDDGPGLRAINWIEEHCRQKKGEWYGKLVELLDWEKDCCMRLLGWKLADGDADGDLRRFRKVVIFIPKKNGKTTFLAALALFFLTYEGEKSPDIYCSAATEKQGGILFEEAESMIEQSEILSKVAVAYGAKKKIHSLRKGGVLEVLATKTAVNSDGLNVFLAIFDELHAAVNEKNLFILEDGMVARRQPITVIISTAGTNEDGPLAQRVALCRDLNDLDGDYINVGLLGMIWEAPAEMAWDEEETWKFCNPGYGITTKTAWYKDRVNDCRRSKIMQANFERKNLNRFGGGIENFLDMKAWATSGEPVDFEALEGAECYGGIDLSSKLDMTAFVLLFALDGGRFAVLPFFWLPENNIEKIEDLTGKPLRKWADEGLLELTPGNVIDYNYLHLRVEALAAKYKIQQIGYDPYAATPTVTYLTEELGLELVEITQGAKKLTDPVKMLEALVIDGKILHSGNPVLRWHAASLKVKQNAYEGMHPVKPERDKSTKRIDGIVALLMALCLAREYVEEEEITPGVFWL